MKILTILTGGTIGSVERDHTIDVSSSRSKITHMYKSLKNDDTEFETVSPLNILSENMSAFGWNSLMVCLNKIDFKAYGGVILTHGSDTLSYTSALLAVCFAHIETPLVLVGADYPLDDEKSNGLQNFSAAVELIKSKAVKGVFASYGSREQTNIYLASRLCEAEGFTDKFRDFTGMPFAIFKKGKLEFLKGPYNPSLEQINEKRSPLLKAVPELENAVLLLTPYPAFDYDSIVLGEKTKAVLQLTYHSGTVCTQGESSALDFLEKCRKRDVDFYLCPLKNRESIYITTREMIKKGAVPLYSQSREAAFAKLMVAYSQGETDPLKIMEKNIFFERIDKK